MSTRTPIQLPAAPAAGAPTYRFWGHQKPPADAERLCSVVVRKATEEPTRATLRIYGPIDSWGGFWGVSAKEVAEALDALDESVTDITVRVNSPGGECFEGLAILNLLRAHRARVTAVVDGLAASAASFIAAGCDETVMAPGTTMMIHDPWSSAWGCNADEMRKEAGILDKIAESMASLYADAAGGTAADWRAVMVEETWYTADEAVTAGLAQSVAVIPDTGQVATAGNDEHDDAEDPLTDPAALFDLSHFAHAGRTAAPAPRVAPGIAAHARDFLRAQAAQDHTPPAASADGSTTHQEGTAVFTDEQITEIRGALNLSADADADAVLTALRERTSTQNTSTTPEGMQLVERDVLAELRAGAAAGREAQATLAAQERDRTIAAAVADGRITPARRDHWSTAYDADPEGTRQILASLEPGLVVNTTEAGHGGQPEAADDTATFEAAHVAFLKQQGITTKTEKGA
ncbi:head maturation protease, ClpP-related [Nocardioides sp. GY 10127]|uniref:head maturation protease, ClpP-related n=1 Tax=Nocardioides sp. GY 10127 TaxID=2569762 RepID=UPI0010A8ABED|nr:head maturation protease, ClpP-related [Nocardioides sp. GY 10127]TIC78786.1 peptidase [Nocardioides sp. GY 10127]